MKPDRDVLRTATPPEPGVQPFVSPYAIGIIVVVCAVLYFAKDVFLPLTLGMLFAFILTPVVNFLRRRGLHEILAVALTVTAATALVASFFVIVITQLGIIGSNLPQYQGNVLGKIDSLLAAGNDNRIINQLQMLFENISSRIGTLSSDAGTGAPRVEVVEQTNPLEWLTGVILPALRPVVMFGIVVVIVTFALFEREALRDRLVQLIGGANILASSQLLAEAGARVSTYLLALVIVNVIYAVPIWLGLWLIGVPNALFFGIVTLVARFLPYVGSFISAFLPILMAFAVSPDWSMVLWTVGLFLVVEFVTSNAIEPYFYGSRTGISPLAVIISALFWTWLWGPLGLFLATPLTVCLVVMGYHVPGLRLFSIVLGSRPVLEEPARLYDRLLAGRAFAATEQVAAAAGKHSLPEYYNRTLIPALMLAEADHQAGLLSELQISRIAHVTLGLMQDLEAMAEDAEPAKGEDDADAAGGGGLDRILALPQPVVVLGARSRLDEVAALLVGQQLMAQEVNTIVLPSMHGITERLRDAAPGALVIASLGGVPQQVLALQVRQLRRWFPNAQVMVVSWPGRTGPDDDALTASGVDHIRLGTEAPGTV